MSGSEFKIKESHSISYFLPCLALRAYRFVGTVEQSSYSNTGKVTEGLKLSILCVSGSVSSKKILNNTRLIGQN